MSSNLDADVAIVGGGVLGCSLAWQLARRGVPRVVVLERHAIGSGASAVAAGLVSQYRSTPELLALVRATLADIDDLGAGVDGAVGFRRTGSLRVAETAETADRLASVHALLRGEGVAARFIDPMEANRRVPWLDATGASAVLFIPDDGVVDGQSLALAYARAARALGVSILSHTTARAPRLEDGHVNAIETDAGTVRLDTLVNATGAWAAQLQDWFGHTVAATPLRSHYWIARPPRPAWPRHPVVVLTDAGAYLRPEVGGLLIGLHERSSRSYDALTLPAEVSELPLTSEDDWDLLASHAEAIRRCFPRFDELEFTHHIAGISSYTPDRRFLIGATPGIDNLYLAAGCCGTAVSCAGGIGRLLCDLVLDTPPLVPPAPFDPGRFDPVDPDSPDFVDRCIQARASKTTRT